MEKKLNAKNELSGSLIIKRYISFPDGIKDISGSRFYLLKHPLVVDLVATYGSFVPMLTGCQTPTVRLTNREFNISVEDGDGLEPAFDIFIRCLFYNIDACLEGSPKFVNLREAINKYIHLDDAPKYRIDIPSLSEDGGLVMNFGFCKITFKR